jgi:hypothetical protein
MTVEIKVMRRTVTIQPLKKSELNRYKYEEVTVGSETHYLNCVSEEKEIKLCVKGEWHPLTGEVDLYHYEESAFPASPAMIEKYLKFKIKPPNEVVGPEAER